MRTYIWLVTFFRLAGLAGFVSLAGLAGLVGLAATPALAAAQTQGGASAFGLEPDTRVLAPIQYKQLAIFPVVKQSASTRPSNYLTLAAGLAQKEVAVTEDKRGANVNQVTVHNRSQRPLLLLGGQVILGGQQDRIIGKDTIIEPRTEAKVEVFCVEHGRWSGGREFTGAGGLAENKVRMRAKYRSDQGQVWAQVAEKTQTLKAESSTGTYRSIATGQAGERAIKPYREFYQPAVGKLPEQKQVVGLIAAINGRVTSVDVFASPELFSAYRDQLLDSIFVSSADVAPTQAAAKPPSPADIKHFIDDAEAAPAQTVLGGVKEKAATIEKKGKKVVNSRVEDRSKPAATPVYQSYQANE
jgi:hypothetical protein